MAPEIVLMLWYYTGLFDSIICTGQFEDTSSLKEGHEMITKLTKRDVCAGIGAQLLIDDSLENALLCTSPSPDSSTVKPSAATAPSDPASPFPSFSLSNASTTTSSSAPTPTLLFGQFEWNKRQSFSTDNRPEAAFDARLAAEGPEFWKKDDVDIEAKAKEGLPLWRVRDWAEAVRWIGKAKKEGRLI